MTPPIHLAFVLGTRPEAIKLAPLILAAQSDRRFQITVISTGQHEEMLKPILQLFGIRLDHDLKLMRPGQDLANFSSQITAHVTDILKANPPRWTIVQGDTLTCLSSALAAYLLRLPVAHIEAGLRTHNLNAPWPEEFNRRVTTLCSDLHLAPTLESRDNLLRENVDGNSIHITGNTGIDAQLIALDLLHSNPVLQAQVNQSLPQFDPQKQLILLTTHRREALGGPLKRILEAVLAVIDARPNVEVAIPVHKNPEVRRTVMQTLGASGKNQGRIHLLEPLDYLTFLGLMEKCTIILTDSGGVQEEAPTLRKPVLVLRETTERDEAVKAGCAKLVGFNPSTITTTALALLDHPEKREAMFAKGNPFGDGKAASRILDIFAQLQMRKTG